MLNDFDVIKIEKSKTCRNGFQGEILASIIYDVISRNAVNIQSPTDCINVTMSELSFFRSYQLGPKLDEVR